ncbi:hypothetical protein [Promicromonospora sp. AC04]|nr:hypothetical protein [Promicromonospora sp. AC04]
MERVDIVVEAAPGIDVAEGAAKVDLPPWSFTVAVVASAPVGAGS